MAEEEAAKARLVGQQGASKPTSVKYIKFQPEAEDDLNPRQYVLAKRNWPRRVERDTKYLPTPQVRIASGVIPEEDPSRRHQVSEDNSGRVRCTA